MHKQYPSLVVISATYRVKVFHINAIISEMPIVIITRCYTRLDNNVSGNLFPTYFSRVEEELSNGRGMPSER